METAIKNLIYTHQVVFHGVKRTRRFERATFQDHKGHSWPTSTIGGGVGPTPWLYTGKQPKGPCRAIQATTPWKKENGPPAARGVSLNLQTHLDAAFHLNAQAATWNQANQVRPRRHPSRNSG